MSQSDAIPVAAPSAEEPVGTVLKAPLTVIDPETGQTVMALRKSGEGWRFSLFHSNGKTAVTLAAAELPAAKPGEVEFFSGEVSVHHGNGNAGGVLNTWTFGGELALYQANGSACAYLGAEEKGSKLRLCRPDGEDEIVLGFGP